MVSENLLCVWQPLLESTRGGLVEGVSHPQHQDKHMVLLGQGQSHGQERAHGQLPSPVSSVGIQPRTQAARVL